MKRTMTDAEAAAFYADPANQEIDPDGPPPVVGPPKHRGPVPVRFDPDTVETIRRLAQAERMTVSAWIRRAVTVQILATAAKQQDQTSDSGSTEGDIALFIERSGVDPEVLKAALSAAASVVSRR